MTLQLTFSDLLLDVKIEIAKICDEAWITLVVYDKEFKKYAYTPLGIMTYKKYFMDTILPVTNHEGVKRYYYHGKLHRFDGPAVILKGGEKWYSNGELHRDFDEPAIIYYNLYQIWYMNGLIHRDHNKPAMVYND